MKLSIRKALSRIGNILFVLVVVFLCFYIVAAAQNRAPSIFGFRVLRVLTDSMSPVFESGSIILIQNTDTDALETGDIITFSSSDPELNNAYNTHRIYDVIEDTESGERLFFTKGDNNQWEDDYEVEENQIVGRYVGNVPCGQLVSKALDQLSNAPVYFLVVIVPIILCMTSAFGQLFREIKGKHKDDF